jgi:hypothetical protein
MFPPPRLLLVSSSYREYQHKIIIKSIDYAIVNTISFHLYRLYDNFKRKWNMNITVTYVGLQKDSIWTISICNPHIRIKTEKTKSYLNTGTMMIEIATRHKANPSLYDRYHQVHLLNVLD